MPKVSVIIPFYNVEEYFDECLRSVINQTYPDIEIICVDDCGSDNSRQIAEKYAQQDKRISIISHNKNRGLGPARNTGLEKAKGEYIFFLDSDDYLKEDIIEKLVIQIEKTQADVVFCKSIAFTSLDDEATQKRVASLNRWLEYEPEEKRILGFENIKNILKLPYVAWNKLYKKEFLIKNNLRFIDANVIHEDLGFSIKMYSAFPVISLTNALGVMYRIRKNAITTNTLEPSVKKFKHKSMWKNIKDATGYIKKYQKKNSKMLLKLLRHSKVCSKYYNEFSILRNLFSVTNDKKHKVITILGLKFKIKIYLPFISVIVASYNYENYIIETLKSLAEQTYKNFEVIIVDDASSDNSVEVIKNFIKDKNNFKLYINEKNMGLSETLQKALKHAKGDYVAFCESDDFFSNNYIEQKTNYVKKYRNAKFIVNDIQVIEDGCNSDMRDWCNVHAKTLSKFNTKNIYNFIKEDNIIMTFSIVMVKANVLKKCDFNTPDAPWLDFWLWKQILLRYPVHYIDKKLTFWRIHGKSYIKRTIQKIEDENKRRKLFRKKAKYFLKKMYPIAYYAYKISLFFRK